MNNTVVSDITIVGGGLSGICAAISASRYGAKVALITNRPVLGGNSSSEIRVWTRGASGGGNIYGEEMGILGELKMYNEHLNPSGNPILWDEVLLDKVLQEENIKLFLNTFVDEVRCEQGQIKEIKAKEIISERRFSFISKMFIDASGDGVIGKYTDIPYVIGKESYDYYQEAIAGKEFINETQGNTILLFTRKTDHKVRFIPPKFAYSVEKMESILNNGGRIVNEHTNGVDYWWVELGGTKDTINDAQEISLEDKKLIYGIFNYIKNSNKFDADNLEIEWVGSIAGKRESRRFITEYVLKYEDLVNNTKFEDVGFYGGWFIDFHPSNGIYADEEFCKQTPVLLYEIPLRTLYNKKVNNLFFAGRIIGASHYAFASSRVMNTCGLSGQASGTMAAYLVKNGKYNDQIESDDVKKIQQMLKDSDMFLLHLAKNEGANLLKEATIFSHNLVAFKEVNGKEILKDKAFITLPNNLAQKAKLVLNAHKETVLKFKLYSTFLPQRSKFYGLKQECEVKLALGVNELDLSTYAQYQNTFLTLSFEENLDVEVNLVKDGITGVYLGHLKNPNLKYPQLIYEDLEYFGPSNLCDGYNRPYLNANVFATNLNKDIEIEFDEPKTIKEIELYFNPNLSIDLVSSKTYPFSEHHMITYRNGLDPLMVKEFKIFDDKGNIVFEEKENYERKKVIKFNNLITNKLVLNITKTYGSNIAEVFEIIIK